MVSVVTVVPVVSFRWFRFGVQGFTTCPRIWLLIMAVNSASASSDYNVLDIIVGYRKSLGVLAALNHGIFEYLEKNNGGRTARQIATDLTLDEVATTVLLDSCTSVDLLVKEIPEEKMENALYSNSEQTKRYLLKSSPDSLYSYAISHARCFSKLMANFEHTVKDGKSQWQRTFGKSSEETFNQLYESKDKLIEFVQGMENRTRMCVSSVLGPFDLSCFNHLCDLGGAGGTVSYTAVTTYPKMKATVFELPQVVRVAEHFKPSLTECPNRDNVTFIAGDFFKDDLPPADLYSICSILHDWDEVKINVLLEKVFNSLPSGGGILIGEIILDDDKRGPWEAFASSMFMLTICTGGRERSGKEYEELLTKHGFTDVQYHQHPIPYLPGGVFARKQ